MHQVEALQLEHWMSESVFKNVVKLLLPNELPLAVQEQKQPVEHHPLDLISQRHSSRGS